MAYDFGLLSMDYWLLWGIAAYHFGLLSMDCELLPGMVAATFNEFWATFG